MVGLLIRARKKDLLTFNGEMLYQVVCHTAPRYTVCRVLVQGRDDEEWIVLTRNINTIHAFFGRDGLGTPLQ